MAVLAGVRVLEFATGLAGPYAGQLLAAYGASVTKVERPVVGDFARTWGPLVDDQSLYFAVVNRGKRSVGIDLKTAEGRDLALGLVESSDVLIENFRPGTLESWQLGPDVLHQHNPDLVVCRISGFGQAGPYRELPAFDPIVQALSGFMSVNGEPDGPPVRSPVPLCDILTGMQGALAVLAGLQEPPPRRHNVIDLSLLDVMIANLFPQNLVHLGTEEPIERMGNTHPSLSPYEVFDTADGAICVAVANDAQWERFCKAIGRPEMAHDGRFRTNSDRLRNREHLRTELDTAFPERTASAWVEALQQHAVPCAPINTVADAYADPHVRQRDLAVAVPLPDSDRVVQLPTIPPHNWQAFGGNGAPPPSLGQHTEEVLATVGVDPVRLEQLRVRGIVQ